MLKRILIEIKNGFQQICSRKKEAMNLNIGQLKLYTLKSRKENECRK